VELCIDLVNVIKTLQILYISLHYYRIGPYFAFITAVFLLGTNSYKFRTTLDEVYTILLRITSSSYSRDVGGGILFLILVSETDQNDSMIFKSGDCVGQETW
jgi:hypothetical protein